MDQNKLIDEILARVAAKLAESDDTPGCGAGTDDEPTTQKPGLLVLGQTDDQCCSQIAGSSVLREHFDITCAVAADAAVDLSAQACVVLCQLTNEMLSKLALGICDTPYTRLASQAILMGKQVYILTEQVELYRYATTAPAPYYAAMEAHLNLLTASGAVICSQQNLEDLLTGGTTAYCTSPCQAPVPCTGEGRELKLDKRVLTEKDVADAAAARVTCIRLPAKCILTALAKDCAKERGICLELG